MGDTHPPEQVAQPAQVVDEVRRALKAAARPEAALGMQSYMKSEMPFLGVSADPLRAVCRDVFGRLHLPDRVSWESAVRSLWDEAGFREERYAALNLTRHRSYRAYQDLETLRLYRHLVETGAWWDYVDAVASVGVGPILRADHGRVAPLMRAWANDDHMWVRRTAILCQLGSKASTDVDLLRCVVEANLEQSVFGKEFFVRKAIGWALREYAKTDPPWVRATVHELGDQLSPLSRREALRNLSA